MELFYLFDKNKYGFKVGKISDKMREVLNAKTNEIIFSDVSVEKNIRHHPDLTKKDYQLLPDIIGKSHFVIKDGEHTIAVSLIINEGKEIYYHYALKKTKTGKAIFLTSFRKTSLKDIKRLRKKAQKGNAVILKDFMP
jgi:hypothetical protein